MVASLSLSLSLSRGTPRRPGSEEWRALPGCVFGVGIDIGLVRALAVVLFPSYDFGRNSKDVFDVEGHR